MLEQYKNDKISNSISSAFEGLDLSSLLKKKPM